MISRNGSASAVPAVPRSKVLRSSLMGILLVSVLASVLVVHAVSERRRRHVGEQQVLEIHPVLLEPGPELADQLPLFVVLLALPAGKPEELGDHTLAHLGARVFRLDQQIGQARRTGE